MASATLRFREALVGQFEFYCAAAPELRRSIRAIDHDGVSVTCTVRPLLSATSLGTKITHSSNLAIRLWPNGQVIVGAKGA